MAASTVGAAANPQLTVEYTVADGTLAQTLRHLDSNPQMTMMSWRGVVKGKVPWLSCRTMCHLEGKSLPGCHPNAAAFDLGIGPYYYAAL